MTILLLLASLVSLATSKPLIDSLKDAYKHTKLAQLEETDCSEACSFDCMLNNACSLQDYCASEFSLIEVFLGGSYDCSGTVPDDFYVELNFGGISCFDSIESEDVVGVDEYDRVNGYCSELLYRDVFGAGATLLFTTIEARYTEPATKAGSFFASTLMKECEMSDDSIDYGNRSYCGDGCYDQVLVNDQACSLETCIDCGNGTYTVDCSNIDPALVETGCDEENEIGEASLIRYFQSVNGDVPVETNEPGGVRVTTLLFSTEGSEVTDTELGIWDKEGNLLAENDDRTQDSLSEIELEASSLPAVYYVGGSEFSTAFYGGFFMNGTSFLLGQSGNITFSLNGAVIGTKELGDSRSTGLPEYALFRVEVGSTGEIISVQDESPASPFPPPCSVADALSGERNCTVEDACSRVQEIVLAYDGFECGINEEGGLTVVAQYDPICYNSVSQVYEGETVAIADLDAIPEGSFCESQTFVDLFDASGQYVLGNTTSVVSLSGMRNHSYVEVYLAVSCDQADAIAFFSLGQESHCYVANDCSSTTLDGEACTGTCASCDDEDRIIDCSNIDASLVQSCDDTSFVAQLAPYLDDSISQDPIATVPPVVSDPDSVLVFTTDGSSIQDTQMALWSIDGTLIDQNDDRSSDALSEIGLERPELPAVYYVGGSQYQTFFYDNFGMDGDAMEPDQIGTIAFSLNGANIGTKELGDAETTGLPEFALFRVEIGSAGEIVSVEDVPITAAFSCSMADYFASAENCTLDVVCDALEAQLALNDAEFSCGLNDDGGLTSKVVQLYTCYDDLSLLTDDNAVLVDDVSTIDDGTYCESTTDTDVFDSLGNHISSIGISTIRLSNNRTHTYRKEYALVSCDNGEAVKYFTLGNEAYCYALDDCSAIFVNGEACTGTCAACDFANNHADCSNIDPTLVQSCDDYNIVYGELFMYLDGLSVESPVAVAPISILPPAPTEAPVVETPVLAPIEISGEVPFDPPEEAPVEAPVEVPVEPPVEVPVEEPPMDPSVEASAPTARSNAGWKSVVMMWCLSTLVL